MSDLVLEINELVKEFELKVVLLSELEEQELFTKLKINFGFDYNKLFIWQMALNFIDIEYESDEWQEIWCKNLDGFNDNIYICISDETLYPWKIYFGPKDMILNIICELPFFEYFIFDGDMEKVIFDTHHNFFRIITI
ncbi:MAG: hypothetical protein IPN86_15635 [Saprospiraceae bacterium]|nr:hypothetical protein [Saprospiraceae bacterium]